MKSKRTSPQTFPAKAASPRKTDPTRDWKCRQCGCVNERACSGGCCWVEKNLCSACLAHSDNFTITEVKLIYAALRLPSRMAVGAVQKRAMHRLLSTLGEVVKQYH